MAPEQVEGGDADARSDVFAVGTILYWLATGTLPFSGKNPHQVLKRVVDCAPVDPLLVRPTIGAPLRDDHLALSAQGARPSAIRAPRELATALTALLLDMGIDSSKTRARELPRATPRAESAAAARAGADAPAAARHRLRSPCAIARATIERIDRVLALDDGNARALSLLASSIAAPARCGSGTAAAVLAGLTALAGSVAGRLRRPMASSTASSCRAVRRSSSRRCRVRGNETLPTSSPAPFHRAAAASDAKPQAARSGAPTATRHRTAHGGVRARAGQRDHQRGWRGPRKPFGPSFHKVELAPGPHTFRFVGAHECCDDAVIQLDIPAGPGETVVRAKLAFRDARAVRRQQRARRREPRWRGGGPRAAA